METGFLYNGEEVEVITHLETGEWMVREMYENCDTGAPISGDIKLVNNVYTAVPIQKVCDEVRRLNREIDDLRKERIDIVKKIEDIKLESIKVIEKFNKYDELKIIEDYIDGKITHYVLESNYKIIEISDKECEHDRGHLKLVSLKGTIKGGLQWVINRYSDGSGSDDGMFPCKSLEEGAKMLQKIIDRKCAENLDGYKWYNIKLIDAAKEYGLKIPQAYIDGCRQQKIEQAEANIKSSKANVLIHEAKLKEYKRLFLDEKTVAAMSLSKELR